MKKFLKRIFAYIMENKKETLPQAFIFYFLLAYTFATNFLPVNIWMILHTFTSLPIFGYSFFRTLAEMEKDNMSYWDCVFVVIVLPFLMIFLPFVLAFIFGILYLLIFGP